MGFTEVANKKSQPHEVELAATLEDGKPAAVRCRVLVTIDFFGVDTPGFNESIPILTGEKSAEDLAPVERLNMYKWFRELVAKAVVSVRDVLEDGSTIWRPTIFENESIEEAFLDDEGKLHLNVRIIEKMNNGDISGLATAIIQRANHSPEMESAKRGDA